MTTATRIPDADTEEKISSAQMAYDKLRRKVLSFALLPAEKINEVALADELAISRTPLREALNRLVAEGILVRRERGFSVPALEPVMVRNLFEARTEIECCTVHLACKRATDAEIAQVGSFLAESVAESSDASVDRLVTLDCGFHERIAGLSGNDELLRILRNLNDRIHLIRWIKMEGKRTHTQGEHLAILDCLKRRDADGAEALMRSHILHRNDEIIAAIRQSYAHIYTAGFRMPV